MRKLALLLLILFQLLVNSQSAVAVPAFKSNDEIVEWIHLYYKNPTPDRVADAIQHMAKSGIIASRNNGEIIGFMSGVFAANPDKVSSWIAQAQLSDDLQLRAIVLSVWYAAIPESQKIIQSIIDKRPKLLAEFGEMVKRPPTKIEQISLEQGFEQGFWVLDALSGKFGATGDKAMVERTIAALPWADLKADKNRREIGGYAALVLTANAMFDRRVLEFCEASLRHQPPEVAKWLEEIIEDAKAEWAKNEKRP